MFYRHTYEPTLRFADSDTGMDTSGGSNNASSDNNAGVIDLGDISGSIEAQNGGFKDAGTVEVGNGGRGDGGGGGSNVGSGPQSVGSPGSTTSSGMTALQQAAIVGGVIGVGLGVTQVVEGTITDNPVQVGRGAAQIAGGLVAIGATISGMNFNLNMHDAIDAASGVGFMGTTAEVSISTNEISLNASGPVGTYYDPSSGWLTITGTHGQMLGQLNWNEGVAIQAPPGSPYAYQEPSYIDPPQWAGGNA